MSATAPAFSYPHIEVMEGSPVIAGSTMKVVELVMAQRAHGWSPEELCFQFPYLSMSQIHAALTYYWDHQSQVDEAIEESTRNAENARQATRTSPLAQRLAALKHRR